MFRSKLGVVLFSSVLAVLLVIGGLKGKPSASGDGAYRQLSVYTDVLSRIRSDYVEEPNMKEVTSGALQGLMEALDPFSAYLSPEEYAEYQKRKAREKGDVGIFTSKKFGYVVAVAVAPNGPAAKAGIRGGDILESINGQSTRDISLEKARTLLNGKPGTTVNLSVVSNRSAEPQKITVKREALSNTSISAKNAEPGVVHIRIDSFPKGRSSEVAHRLQQAVGGGARSILLDVRNAADGEVSEAVAIADLFLERGLITYLQGQKHARQDFSATAGGAKVRLPVLVLVNRSSAGPAEVLAAALQENGRAEVVGEKTFGVGSVQKVIPLDDGSALLLSVAKYYTPGGKAIQDGGITPNVLVAESRDTGAADPDEDEPPAPQPDDKPSKEDVILKKALEILKGGEKKAA